MKTARVPFFVRTNIKFIYFIRLKNEIGILHKTKSICSVMRNQIGFSFLFQFSRVHANKRNSDGTETHEA